MADNNRNWRDQYNQRNEDDWQQSSSNRNRRDDYNQSYQNSNYNDQRNQRSWESGGFDDMDDNNSRRSNVGDSHDRYSNTNSPYQSRNRGYNQGGQQGASYGNQSHGNWGNQQWRDQNQNWNRNEDQWGSAGMYGGDFGRDDWERGNTGGGNYGGSYGRSQYGNQYGNQQNMNYGGYGSQQQDRNRYNKSSQGNYSPFNRGDDDSSWWDRARNKVSSWFNDDDDNRQRGQNQYSTGHRGKGPKDYQRSSDRIREDICDRLSDDDHLDATHIQVQVQGNEVVLSGTVNDRYQKRYAEDLVESVSGVRHVENRIRVGAASGDLSSHDYTGNTDKVGGIGTESGTTNEIIRNVANDKNGNR